MKSVSHNLKTPLVCVSNMLENLYKDSEISESVKANTLDPAIKSCEILNYFIQSFLDYSQI